MPELPEVEEARRCLERWARGRRVRAVEVRERRVLAGGGPALAQLVGARFETFDRRGKHLLLTLRKARAPIGLWSHLGMTGKWLLRERGDEPPRFSRVKLDLDDRHTLHYADLRLFGRLRVVPGADFQKLPAVAALGPDPLADGIDVDRLAERLARRRLPVKPLLLDQKLLAGVGNIQASEALFRAGIDPRRPASSLTRPEVKKLARAIEASIAFTLAGFEREVAKKGQDIRYVEEPDGPNPFLVYDRAGARCSRCKTGKTGKTGKPGKTGTIVRLVQAGRSTFYCDHHQK